MSGRACTQCGEAILGRYIAWERREMGLLAQARDGPVHTMLWATCGCFPWRVDLGHVRLTSYTPLPMDPGMVPTRVVGHAGTLHGSGYRCGGCDAIGDWVGHNVSTGVTWAFCDRCGRIESRMVVACGPDGAMRPWTMP